MAPVKTHAGFRVAITANLGEFPFRSEFSLAPLIRFWEQEVAGGCSILGEISRTGLDQVRMAPELAAPVVDPAVVRAHEDVLSALMLAVVSPTFHEDGYAAAPGQFGVQRFYATPAFT